VSEFQKLLADTLRGRVPLPAEQCEALARHWELLQRWNRRVNLTAVRDVKEAVPLHYCESVFFSTLLPEGPMRVADIGSGAGFPGLPLAVMRPGSEVWLVEANSKKCVFLREAARAMGLGNVRVLERRAEEMEESVDWVVSRAVRWTGVIELARRLARHVGLLVSEQGAEEARGAAGLDWRAPVRIPWGRRRVALLGDVLEPGASCRSVGEMFHVKQLPQSGQ